MARKGMMVGRGSGYKNVIGKDPHVHSQSAKGIKQPQRVNSIILPDMYKQRYGNNPTLEVMGIPMSSKQYLSVLDYVKREHGEDWNKINSESRKLMIQNHIEMNFPASSWKFTTKTKQSYLGKPKYEIVVDTGIPDTITANSKEELMKKLREIGDKHKNEDVPYFDVKVYEGEKDITDKSFEELDYNNEKGISIQESKNEVGEKGYSVVKDGHVPEIAMGEKNWFPTKKEAENYKKDFDKDRLKGGLGDNRPDSDFDPKELKKGIKVEMEHTNNPEIAEEIAKDHITEFPKGYYEELDKMEKKLKKENKNPIIEKRYEVWEGNILRASQTSKESAEKYMGKGRTMKIKYWKYPNPRPDVVDPRIAYNKENLKIIRQNHKDIDSFHKEFGLKPLNKPTWQELPSKTYSQNPKEPHQRTFVNGNKKVSIVTFPENNYINVIKRNNNKFISKKEFPNTYEGHKQALKYAGVN